MMTWARSTLVACLLGCGPGTVGSVDGGNDSTAGPCALCSAGEVCRYATCVPTPRPCATIDDCVGDFYCDNPPGECLPWGVGPGGTSDTMCTRDVVPGVFYPDVQCEWLGPPAGDPFPSHTNVLSTPMVADFGGGGDPELRRPAIVFLTYNFNDGGTQSCVGSDPAYTGVIRVIDGRTCEQQTSISAPVPIAASTLALGDLTGDGVPEIVGVLVGGALGAWQRQNDGSFSLLWQSNVAPAAGLCVWTGPAIHDLDDDGVPEVLFYGAVFTAGGTYVSDVGLLSGGLAAGYIPVAADLDQDGVVELVGGSVYQWNSTTNQWDFRIALGPDAQTAVADLGTFPAGDRATLDGIAEVIAVQAGTITAYALTGAVIFSAPLPGGGNGGPPTIADFDGDGRAEFASAGGNAYTVFDLDCLGIPDNTTCASLSTSGILWTQPSQDLSSSRTGSSVFDFEGDGPAEAVYGDECFLRVYEGQTGEVMYSRFRTSCTWYENPIIADVDFDFGAELIVTSNTNCNISCPAIDPIFDGIRCFDESDCPGATNCGRENVNDTLGRCRCQMDTDCGGDGFVCADPIAGPSGAGRVCRAAHPGPSSAMGLRVIGDQLGRWVATRPIWNQHAYAVTHVDDSGVVPRTASWLPNWLQAGLNSFRQNAPGDGAGAGLMPDLTVRSGSFTCPASGTASIDLEVCNRGTEPVADGVSVAVYDGNQLACLASTGLPLRPGFCQALSCTHSSAPTTTARDLRVVIDDDGTASGEHTECRESNNDLTIPDVACP